MSEKLGEKVEDSDNIGGETDIFSENNSVNDDYTDDVESLVIPEQANLCSKRIQTLLSDFVESKNPNEKITLRPLVCDSEYADTSVLDETGIPELFNLYKDVYNPNIGRFYEMSPEAKRQYQKDVKLYYTTVTGKKVVPKELGELNFSKIKLKDYTATEKCIGPDAPYQKEYYGTIKERLFQQYIQHIKDMIAKTNKSKGKLLDILDQVFTEKKVESSVISDDGEKTDKTVEKVMVISPTLTMRKLDKLIAETRRIIVKLYIDCEKDFEKGLQIFEAIVEKVRFDTSLRRLENFNKDISELSSDPVYVASDLPDASDNVDENEKDSEFEEEEIAAQKSCLRYPGWRKYTDATGRSIWVDPENKNKFYGNVWGNRKDPKNTAIMRDKELCDEAAKRNDYKCDDVTRNWPTTVFYDSPGQYKKCEKLYKDFRIKIDGQMWIQCDICNKWRKIPQMSASAIPEKYDCGKCEEPEETWYSELEPIIGESSELVDDDSIVLDDGDDDSVVSGDRDDDSVVSDDDDDSVVSDDDDNDDDYDPQDQDSE